MLTLNLIHSARLATVRSGPDRGLICRPLKKTGPYGPANWDRSPDRKIRSGLGKKQSGLKLKWRPIKRPDCTVRHSGTAVRSGPRESWTGPYGPV